MPLITLFSFNFRMNLLIIRRQLLLQTSFRFNARFLSIQRLKSFSRIKSTEKGPITTGNVTEIPRGGSDLTQSEIDILLKNRGHREDWQVIYRLRAMPFAQAFSKLKLLLTFSLAAGTPISLALHFAGRVSSDLCWFVFGASLFSLATLGIFSYYSTKVIGVVSFLISFWST